MIKDSAEGMLRTVLDLLERHQQGLPAKLNMEQVDLNIITRVVVNWNKQQAVKKEFNCTFIPQKMRRSF